MGKIIMWDLDWHNEAWGDELEQLSTERLNQCNTLIFGRVTHEGMAAQWQSPDFNRAYR